MRRMFSLKQLQEIADARVQTVASSGDLENVKVFENIVDKDGHKRFIEGNLDKQTIAGITFTYAKWSLSGSHLLLVLAGNIPNGTTIPSSTTLANVNVPQWVLDKIVPTFSNVIDIKNIAIYADNWTSQSCGIYLYKQSSSVLKFNLVSELTTTADRMFRFAFDLLIDNE